MKSKPYNLALQLHSDFKNIHHLNTMLPCWFRVHLPIKFGPFIKYAYKSSNKTYFGALKPLSNTKENPFKKNLS